MRNISFMFALLCFTFASGIGCGKGQSLAPCNGAQQRLWCKGVVNQSTVARMDANIEAPLCAIPFSATACVDRTDNRRAMIEFIQDALVYLRNYSETNSGASPILVFGDTVIWAGLPIQEKGQVQCSFQPGNPWPTLPVVDLESVSPPTFGPRPKPQSSGFGGFGTGGGGVGGFEEIGNGFPQCHDSSLPSPLACVSPGGACSGASPCCAPMACFDTGTGSSICM